MNFYIKLILDTCIALALIFYASIACLIKQIVPYKYRCKSVKGQICLVTGSGSGIGKLMAKKFAKLGARMILVDVNEPENNKTANEILIDGGNAQAFKCDLSNRDEIYKLADQIKKNIGDVQILVNNAGIVTGKKFLESGDNEIDKTFKVNTFSHFWLAKAFLPAMISKNHGHLVTIASMAGLVGTAGLGDYCASKFAAVGFSTAMSNELDRMEKKGVKTTLVCPFYINTGMFAGAKSELIPFLEPDYVAEKVIEAVLTDQKLLMTPRLMYFLYAVKGIISWEAENYLSSNTFKTNNSMDEFVGRGKFN